MVQSVAPKGFNKALFCIYQSTSDDLMFWCWFDVLILSLNYGLNMTQISLVFSVSFWVSLGMKLPANFLVKRLGAGRSVLLSAFLFLAAAIFLTFGNVLAVAIIGQSIYLVAGSFQEMSTVIAKNAARRDPANVDYMRLMSVTGVIFSVVSLAAAILMNPLYGINENLPMFICIGFCVNSCVLAFFLSKYDTESTAKEEETRKDVLPGARIRAFDKTTVSCLFLSILFMVIFTVSGDNLKILIENDLSLVTDTKNTVFLFSMILLGSRVIKILSNVLLYTSRNKRVRQQRSFTVIVVGIVLIAVLGFLIRWGSGYYAIALAVAAFMIRVLVFDPFRFSIYDFMLKRLKNETMVNVLFVHSTGSDIFTALFSTVSTVLLKFYGMQNVMLMIFVIGMVFAVGYFIIRKNLVRRNENQSFVKWNQTEIDKCDELIVAATVLMMQYGLIQDVSYTPKKLSETISSAEDINLANSNIRFEGYYPYTEDELRKHFNAGSPCAIRAVIKEGEQAHWLPVIYLDDDGGLIWNPYSDECFLVQLYQIHEICCFTMI
jgi:MFS family permease